ncbi:MAG: hypothetical protein WCF12_10130 [Propionicimonas sp.]
MRKIAVSVAALGIALVGFATPAQAAQTTPGIPGDKNCVGQQTAYLAQAGTVNGIGNVAKGMNLTVKEVKALVEAYCTV